MEFYDLVDIGPLSQETNKANLLALEQKHLDWLFSLPESLRYNFNPTAGSSLGYKHTEDTLAKMSGENNPMYGRTGTLNPMYGKVPANAFESGANHPMYGRTHTPETLAKMSVAQSGANNPMYGKVAANAKTIYIYSLDNVLVHSFTSQVSAAKYLGVSNITVFRHLRSGKEFQGKYFITSTPR